MLSSSPCEKCKGPPAASTAAFFSLYTDADLGSAIVAVVRGVDLLTELVEVRKQILEETVEKRLPVFMLLRAR